jgi:outer membrane scaffolding protein for murein synthesis (MipA/OmpV family)
VKLLALFAAALVAGAASVARAETADWTVDWGAAARVRPDHIGSRHYRVDAVPVLQANYGDRIEASFDDGIKWRALRTRRFAAGPIVEHRQSFNDGVPHGAFRMSDAVEVGGFGEVLTPIGVGEARLRHAIGAYDGWSGDLSFNTGKQLTPTFGLGGQLRLSWADSNFTQEYFGLKPHVAGHFGLPHFLDEDFVTVGGELDAGRALTPHIRLVGALSYDRIVGELRPSPLFASRDIATASIGLTYHWSSGTKGRVP